MSFGLFSSPAVKEGGDFDEAATYPEYNSDVA